MHKAIFVGERKMLEKMCALVMNILVMNRGIKRIYPVHLEEHLRCVEL